jgi:hypothetical protein
VGSFLGKIPRSLIPKLWAFRETNLPAKLDFPLFKVSRGTHVSNVSKLSDISKVSEVSKFPLFSNHES